jgi:hypothetical protein
VDFDEIIYPRYFKIDDVFNLNKYEECDNICKFKNRKYNIYDYFTSIVQKSNISKSYVSSIEFKNGFYVEVNKYIKSFMENLNEVIRFNESYFQQPKSLLNDKNIIKLHLKLSPSTGHDFLIYPNDFDYIKYFYSSFTLLTSCLEKSNFLRANILDYSFDRYIYFFQEKYLSKFIHFTDNVDAIYSNYNEFKEPGTKIVFADIDVGVLSNFKNDLLVLVTTNSSIKNLKIDLEFYLNLVTKYQMMCSYHYL